MADDEEYHFTGTQTRNEKASRNVENSIRVILNKNTEDTKRNKNQK